MGVICTNLANELGHHLVGIFPSHVDTGGCQTHFAKALRGIEPGRKLLSFFKNLMAEILQGGAPLVLTLL